MDYLTLKKITTGKPLKFNTALTNVIILNLRKFSLPILFILLIISCSEEDITQPINYSPELSITSPIEGTNFTFGDTVNVVAKLSGLESNLSSKSYFIVNEFVTDSTQSKNIDFTLKGIDYKIGDSKVVVESILENGTILSDTVNFKISSETTPVYLPIIHNVYPHDNTAFTQGLQYYENYLYEGTGLRGESMLKKIKLETGKVLMERRLSDRFFGEGITIVDNRIYQLTWGSGIGMIYSIENFDSLGTFSYETEGWGLTATNEYFILSDGSPFIYFHDLEGFTKITSLQITDDGNSVHSLNELEIIRDNLYANIWYSDNIARIDISEGKVIGWIDLSSIAQNENGGVLNGIAYRSDLNRLLITGKNWDNIYEIELTISE